jgi:hypothetical protein
METLADLVVKTSELAGIVKSCALEIDGSRAHAQMADLLEKIQFGLHPTFSLYYEFCVLGCQGDRMPMYRAFAPFFEGDKGDKRVTGVCVHNQERASGYWFAPPVWL